MKGKIFVIIALILTSLCYAVYIDESKTFYDDDHSVDIYFNGVDNFTEHLDLPYVQIENLTLSMESINLGYPCIQPQANESSGCGGISNGSYHFTGAATWVDIPNILDDNLITLGYFTGGDNLAAYMYVNYTKPSDAISATWNIKPFNNEVYSIPDSCFSYLSDKIQLRIEGNTNAGASPSTTYPQCYNGSWSNLLGQVGENIVYEEAINWTNKVPGNITVFVGIDGHTVNISSALTTKVSGSSFDTVFIGNCSCSGCTYSNERCTAPINFYSNYTGTVQINLSSISYSFGIDNCSDTFGIPTSATAWNISFRSFDDSLASVNYSVALQYGLPTLSMLYNYTNQVEVVNDYQFCSYPNWAIFDSNLESEYLYQTSLLNFHTTDTKIDNSTLKTMLYVDEGTQVTATVFDNNINRLEGAYIYVEKYDWATGNYLLVGTYKTNFEGEATLILTQNTQYYRFKVYYPLITLRETTAPTYITSTTIEFIIDIYDDVLQDYYTVSGIESNLTFNDATNNFKHSFSDSSASISGGCLKIWKVNSSGNDPIDINCIDSTAGTILSSVEAINDTTYLAKSYVIINGNEKIIDSLSKAFHGPDITSLLGLLTVLIITIAFGFIFLFSVPIGIIVMPIPTIMASAIGLIQLDIMHAFGLEILAFVLAFFIDRRG